MASGNGLFSPVFPNKLLSLHLHIILSGLRIPLILKRCSLLTPSLKKNFKLEMVDGTIRGQNALQLFINSNQFSSRM